MEPRSRQHRVIMAQKPCCRCLAAPLKPTGKATRCGSALHNSQERKPKSNETCYDSPLHTPCCGKKRNARDHRGALARARAAHRTDHNIPRTLRTIVPVMSRGHGPTCSQHSPRHCIPHAVERRETRVIQHRAIDTVMQERKHAAKHYSRQCARSMWMELASLPWRLGHKIGSHEVFCLSRAVGFGMAKSPQENATRPCAAVIRCCWDLTSL